MCRVHTAALVALLAFSGNGVANAQTLRVSPVTIELPPQSKSAFITVDSDGNGRTNIQVRVFRWRLVNGVDNLERTTDVVVSPPVFVSEGNKHNVVRLLRLSQAPVDGQETYRIFIEEIPDRRKLQAGQIALALRHSIPIFFTGVDARPANTTFAAKAERGKVILLGSNSGQKSQKIQDLRLLDDSGREIAKLNGLAGYILGQQTRLWELPSLIGAVQPGTRVKIEAQTEAGPIHAQAVVGQSG